MTQKVLALFTFFLPSLVAQLSAFDYKISGRVGSFSRIGFNNAPINTDKGLYPTGSYVTTIGALEINANLLPKSVENQELEVGLGGEIGGLAYD
ncbi:outer membrane family protein, partial [Helicobacter heilmannii]|uniref:outer membrane family protein n=1 Tax=Helicobacter heilmannii TaxID=35817 RepID=UPI001F1A8CD0